MYLEDAPIILKGWVLSTWSMCCHGFCHHGNTTSPHVEIFFLLIVPLYKSLHLSLFLLLLLLFSYKRGFLLKNVVSSFLYRFRGLRLQLGSLDNDLNCIDTCNTKYDLGKEISTRQVPQTDSVTAWSGPFYSPKQAARGMSTSPQKCYMQGTLQEKVSELFFSAESVSESNRW